MFRKSIFFIIINGYYYHYLLFIMTADSHSTENGIVLGEGARNIRYEIQFSAVCFQSLPILKFASTVSSMQEF